LGSIMSVDRYAVLLDGAFALRKLGAELKRFPDDEHVVGLARTLGLACGFRPDSLLRNYFYHAAPTEGRIMNPLSGIQLDLSASSTYRNHASLLSRLELQANFAIRLGEATAHGWRVGDRAMDSLMSNPRAIEAQDLVPDIKQKGVDLRIGLDMARLALRQLVGTVIVVTGDSDLVPAFRFVRREGIRVVLATLAHGVKRDLKVHCDRVFDESYASLATRFTGIT
jgi:uncharacterized LabA/DUF88 family protein